MIRESNDEFRAELRVSCDVCERLHAPERPLALHAICSTCIAETTPNPTR